MKKYDTAAEIIRKLNLKEHTLYKVRVQLFKENMPHIAFLCVGFKIGSYTQIWNNTYEDGPVELENIYALDIIQELCSILSDKIQIEDSDYLIHTVTMNVEEAKKMYPLCHDDINKAMEGRPFDEDEELFPPDITGLKQDPEDVLP